MHPTQSPPRQRALEDDIDRISELGDDMLIEIFSLLSTKEAVQTSLLSKRFLNIWASLPVLDFDVDQFRLQNLEESFPNFIDGVFQSRNQSINVESFKLKWDDDKSDQLCVTQWLDTLAATYRPKFLYLHMTLNYAFQVPDSIFSSKSLQHLQLHLEYVPIMPRSLNLPCLKRLTLESIRIVNPFMQKLSVLSSLEEMVLAYCRYDSCDISSATLKRLVLKGDLRTSPRITVSAPSLLYLDVLSWSQGRIQFKHLKSLVKACIHYDELDNEDPLFLTGLSNATCLELMFLSQSGVLQMKDVLEEETTKFPTFNNLKILKIGEWCMTDEFDLVASFLLHARNLERLTLLHCHCQSHYKVEMSLGFPGNKLHIINLKGINFDIMEIRGSESVELRADMGELLKHVRKIRAEMNINS